MALEIKKNSEASGARAYIGRAWKNEVQKEGKNKGKKFIRLTLDNRIDEVTIKKGQTLLIWPNDNRREGINPKTGKEYRDADFNVQICEPSQA